MNVEKLAYEVGRNLAKLASREDVEKRLGEVNEDYPIASQVMRRGLIGAGVGAAAGGLGLLLRSGMGSRGLHPSKGEFYGGVRTPAQVILNSLGNSAMLGGTVGASSGLIRGSRDAGMLTGYRGKDDSPEARGALTGLALGHPHSSVAGGLAGALAAAYGRHEGTSARREQEG